MTAQEGGRPGGRPGTWRSGPRYTPRRKVCSFCAKKADKIGYKDTAKLSRYISDRGKILPRRRTGTCAKHQRVVASAVKRARHIALLPYTAEHIRKAGNVAAQSPLPIKPEPEPAEPVASPETEEPVAS